MLKLFVILISCSLGSLALAGEKPPYRPSTQSTIHPSPATRPGTQPAPALKPIQSGQPPPYRPNAWSLVINVPKS